MAPRICTEEEVRAFYERWKSRVFAYCLLYLGDEALAEEATEEAFLLYFQWIATTFWSDSGQIPLSLLQATVNAAQKRCAIRHKPIRLGNAIEDVVPFLGCEERMVFVLRSVLDLPYSLIAAATGLEQAQAEGYWTQAMLHVREMLMSKPTVTK